jgi:glycosyltransferase involved in cell wall biosynthesis
MMTSKKILLFDRPDSARFPGGDTVQMREIAQFLRQHGHEVTISSDIGQDLSGFHLVLLFNLTRPFEAFLQAKAAMRAGKPYLLFPVYWDLDSLEMVGVLRGKQLLKQLLTPGLKERMRALSFWRSHLALLKRFGVTWEEVEDQAAVCRYVIRNARFLCPNSRAEWAHLQAKFDVSEHGDRVRVVHNGLNAEGVLATGNEPLPFELPDRFLCCAGGIGPRKNQWQLVKAANQTCIPLVLIGRASLGCEGYAQEVRRIAGEHVYFVDHLSQVDVFRVIRRSQGHIQPSYIETPGLASLEAAALGTPVGVSDVLPVREYFGGRALYCDPYDLQSIASCMERLYVQTQGSQELKAHVLERFRWEVALQPLHELVAQLS